MIFQAAMQTNTPAQAKPVLRLELCVTAAVIVRGLTVRMKMVSVNSTVSVSYGLF